MAIGLDAVAAAQRLMRDIASAPLQLDGKWGKYTDGVWMGLSASYQQQIERKLREEFGVTIEQLRGLWSSSNRFISKERAFMLVAASAHKLGLASHTAALSAFLNREARKMRGPGGEAGYDVGSVNGSSRGLMQMQPNAWVDSYKVAPEIGSYSVNVYNAEKNVLAGVAYARFNIRALQKAGVAVTSDTLYLAHNQGAGFFVNKKQPITGYDKQSPEVRALIDRYRR